MSAFKRIGGTSWVFTSIVGHENSSNNWGGNLELRDKPDSRDMSFSWTAKRTSQDESWVITGEGAIMTDGGRARTVSMYPFSLIPEVNEWVKSRIIGWIKEVGSNVRVKDSVISKPIPFPKRPPAPPPLLVPALTPAAHIPLQTVPAELPPKLGAVRRQPTNVASRLLRILRGMHHDTKLISTVDKADIDSLITDAMGEAELVRILSHMDAYIVALRTFREKLM